jgi:release factor glutamine methyltransferase
MSEAERRWTLKRVLDWTTSHFERKQLDSPRLCAELILAHTLGCQRIRLYTDLNRPLIDDELNRIRDLVRRAGEHEPIQYLTGVAHFYGLEVAVTPDVLIPRPETETLVEKAIDLLKRQGKLEPRVLDLCTGSGCIACAVASGVPSAWVVAVDLSLRAVDVARRNVERLKLSSRIDVLCGDLLAPLNDLPDKRAFDLLLTNPPYIRSSEIATLDRNVRDYEPHLALDGGEDGLKPLRRILDETGDWLAPGGYALIEIAFDQAERALWIVSQRPAWTDASVINDLGRRPRVLVVRKV